MELNSISTALFLSLLISGCAVSTVKSDSSNTVSVKEGSWINTGISEQVFKKAGETAIDCGFHDLLKAEGVESDKFGFDCVEKAVKANKPFMYGTVRIPEDSYAHEFLIRTKSGEYWIVVYDRMLDEDDHQLWLKSCKSIQLSGKYRTYEGTECTERKPDEWQ